MQDKDAAKDLLQEAFIRIFEKIGTFKGTGSLKGWMKTVTVNLALRSCQKIKAKPDNVRLDELHDSMHFDMDLLHSIDYQELNYFIQSLSEGRRQIFNAYVIEGYSHNEIAAEMGITVGTSKSQLFDAKKELKRFINDQVAVVKKASL